MAIGPGKYDDLCTEILTQTEAAGVILVVIEGNRGSGFSVQAPLPVTLGLPTVLRNVANGIESDIEKGKL